MSDDKVLREVQPDGDELSDVVELVDDTGRTLKFYHIGTMDHKEETYVFFQPAEEIEGTEEDDVIIFRVGGEENNEVLLPVEDEALLEEVFEEFCRVMEEEDDAADALDLEDGYCDGNCEACAEEDCEDRD